MVDPKEFWERKILSWESARYSALLSLYPPSWPVRRRLEVASAVILERLDESSRILELGCGSGYLAKNLTRKFSNFTGVDLASNAIEVARKRVSRPGFHFHCGDVTAWESFDCDLTVFLGLTDWLDVDNVRRLFTKITSARVLFSYTQVSDFNPYKLYRWMMDPKKKSDQYGARNYRQEEIVAMLRENGFSYEYVLNPNFMNPGALIWAEKIK